MIAKLINEQQQHQFHHHKTTQYHTSLQMETYVKILERYMYNGPVVHEFNLFHDSRKDSHT